MSKRSRLDVGYLAGEFTGALVSDFGTTTKFLRFQMAKESFNLRHPFGARHGRGDSLQLVSLRITDLCNLRCHTCGQWGDNGYLLGEPLHDLRQREVDVQVYKDLADQIVDLGWSPVWYIWGGEPMLYPGIIELLHYIKAKGMPVTLVSNATKVARYAEDILDCCSIVYLSVDGPNADVHNRQRPGVSENFDNFQDVKTALEVLSARKRERKQRFPYIIALSCVSAYNAHLLADLYRFGSRYADQYWFYLTWWIDRESADQHTQDFERRFGHRPRTHFGWIGDWNRFDHGVIVDQYEVVENLWRKEKRCFPIMLPKLRRRDDVRAYYADHRQTFGYDQCISIYMTFEIDSNGNVSLCRDYHDYVIGNIKTDRVRDMWNNDAAVRFRRSISRDGPMPVCRRCCGLMGF
jgi:radical SAM protein with 4Fe4S-binding SPASM domain